MVIITHKLHEVLSVSDRVAILRKGEYVGTVETATATESSLTEMMVGQKVELNINRTTPQDPTRRLAISHLSVRSPEGTNVLDDVSFDVYGGEILGIAGISGNGQKELLEAIAGLQHTESGSDVKFFAPGEEDKPMELLGKSPKDIRDARCTPELCAGGPPGHGPGWHHGHDGQHDAEKLWRRPLPAGGPPCPA